MAATLSAPRPEPGKTAAYTLPLLNKLLLEGNPDNVVKSLIIVPTRELGSRSTSSSRVFSYYAPISTTVVYGGGDGKGWDIQKKGMLSGSDVVIATPGRMIAHCRTAAWTFRTSNTSFSTRLTACWTWVSRRTS